MKAWKEEIFEFLASREPDSTMDEIEIAESNAYAIIEKLDYSQVASFVLAIRAYNGKISRGIISEIKKASDK